MGMPRLVIVFQAATMGCGHKELRYSNIIRPSTAKLGHPGKYSYTIKVSSSVHLAYARRSQADCRFAERLGSICNL